MSEFIVFNEKILAWALKRARYTAGDLVKEFPFIQSWLEGKRKPTITQTQKLSNKLSVPFGYFCLPSPPEEIPLLPDFRTKGNHPVKEISLGLRKTIEHAKGCQAFLSERLENADAEPFLYEGVLSQHNTPKEGANILKKLLGEKKLSSQENRFKNLLHTIENLGVLIQKNSHVLNSIKHKLDSDEFRGFALCDKYCPLIFLNENDSSKAQIFTLIHEFCHILLGETGISGGDGSARGVERLCDRITVEYLVPEKDFRNCWERGDSQETLELLDSLAEEFCVSKWVIIRRAHELHLISDAFFHEELNKLLAFSKPKEKGKGGPSYTVIQQARLGKLLIDNAIKAAYSGEIPFSEAMRLTLYSANTIQKKALEMGL